MSSGVVWTSCVMSETDFCIIIIGKGTSFLSGWLRQVLTGDPKRRTGETGHVWWSSTLKTP